MESTIEYLWYLREDRPREDGQGVQWAKHKKRHEEVG